MSDRSESSPAHWLASAYNDLRRVARGYMARERREHTLRPTALVHEAYLRVSKLPNQQFGSREEFIRVMSVFMRRKLVDHARRRGAVVHGGALRRVELGEVADAMTASTTTPEEFFDRLGDALEALRKDHPRAARAVALRFFANKTIEQAAAELNISVGTLKRDIAFAKAWLADWLRRS